MNILVSCMGYDAGKSGISSYMKSVVNNLRGTKHSLTLLVESGDEKDFAGFEKIVVPAMFSKGARGFLWHIFCLPFVATSRKFDCLLVLAGNRRFAPFVKIPTVGVIHDLSQYRVSGKYDALRMFNLTRLQPRLGKSFSAIAAISRSTAEDIGKYWGIKQEQITINYNGLNPAANPDDRVFGKFDITKKKYLLYVSRIEHPGKNHIGLINAFEKLPKEFADFDLVIAGADWNGAEEVKMRAQKSPQSAHIKFTGFLTWEEISALYNNAAVFVFPSFSEGFGLGLIEAMSRGIPCACSETSSLGEIGEGAAALFNPMSADDIREKVARILCDPDYAAELSRKGLERAAQFSWSNHADTLLKMCENQMANFSEMEILGVKIRNARLDDILAELQKGIESGDKKTVGFANAHYLNTAYTDATQLYKMRKLDIVLPDGSGISNACKILSIPFRDNLNGTDLLPHLCEMAQAKNFSMYFVGSRDNIAETAAHKLKEIYPELDIRGTASGYFTPDEGEKIIEDINLKNPDMLIVGMGAKLQEKWILDNIEGLNCRLAIAIGAVFDFYSGEVKRAPKILRKLGLEWTWRLLLEPKRLFIRYIIGNPLFIFRVIKQKLRKSEEANE